jgi:hypothetical protein
VALVYLSYRGEPDWQGILIPDDEQVLLLMYPVLGIWIGGALQVKVEDERGEDKTHLDQCEAGKERVKVNILCSTQGFNEIMAYF